MPKSPETTDYNPLAEEMHVEGLPEQCQAARAKCMARFAIQASGLNKAKGRTETLETSLGHLLENMQELRKMQRFTIGLLMTTVLAGAYTAVQVSTSSTNSTNTNISVPTHNVNTQTSKCAPKKLTHATYLPGMMMPGGNGDEEKHGCGLSGGQGE